LIYSASINIIVLIGFEKLEFDLTRALAQVSADTRVQKEAERRRAALSEASRGFYDKAKEISTEYGKSIDGIA